jgi:hypothetical protein
VIISDANLLEVIEQAAKRLSSRLPSREEDGA